MTSTTTGPKTRLLEGQVEYRTSREVRRLLVRLVATGGVLALPPLWLGDSRLMMGIAIGGLLYACYTVAFNVIFGSTGQLFLAVGALAGVGGYLSALTTDRLGAPLLVGLLVGTGSATLVGGLFSWVSVRRSLGVIFTGILTLAFSLAFHNLVLGVRDLTGGETGLVIQAGSDTFLRERVPPYYFFLGLLLVFLLIHGLVRISHIGWAFRALRDDGVAAELAGVDVTRYRVYGALIGSAMLGLSGAVFAHNEGFIGPSTYGFGEVDVVVLVMLALGGIGTLFGPVFGAVVFTVLDELLVEFGQLRVVALGVLVIVLFLGFRRGLLPTVAEWMRRRSLEPEGKEEA
jgi:ABC-type branched-subunit amino acid transport system permease subunit